MGNETSCCDDCKYRVYRGINGGCIMDDVNKNKAVKEICKAAPDVDVEFVEDWVDCYSWEFMWMSLWASVDEWNDWVVRRYGDDSKAVEVLRGKSLECRRKDMIDTIRSDWNES